jgi:O-methyltransferase
LLKLIRPNGVIVVDNTLWSGNVLPDSGHDDPSTAAIRALNDKLYTDDRVDISFLHIADGVTLLRKK